MNIDPYLHKKQSFRNNLISEVQTQNPGFLHNKLYLEFGVMTGESIIDFYNAYKLNNIKADFYGFDSFQGLPEETIDKNSPWKTGKFSTNGHISEDLLSIPSINLVEGWFSDVLNESLLNRFNNKKIGLIHMDCDIYSSTVEVLEYIIQNDLLCDGSLILYDDWGAYLMNDSTLHDEYSVAQAKAHKEITEKYNLDFELIHKEVIDPTFYVMTLFRYNKK
tara:strand:+ start:211 stop:870 length:660 start_codon:yes stop_codon:yes gene_type:complete